MKLAEIETIFINFESQVDTRRQLKTLDKPLRLIQTLRMQNITYAKHYKIGILLIYKDF